MATSWKKLKKSISLRLSTDHSFALSSPRPSDCFSDISEPDLRPWTPTASSSGIRLSRSGSRSSKKTCAICLTTMKPGQGQALFTAECTHSFHFSCIVSSFKHGNQLCPICRSQWKEIPFQAPPPPHIISSDPPQPNNGRARVSPLDNLHIPLQRHLPQSPSEPNQFNDDDPLPSPVAQDPTQSSTQFPTIETFTEFPAISTSESKTNFAVLVSLRAPPAQHSARAPIDLVTVLDVSGSMAGSKLSLLKHAVGFVAHHLGPADRLAVVTFSSSARRVVRLRRMTEESRDRAILAINSLSSGGGTNIIDGLSKGVRVLEERRERNPVASVILLSDGKDTYHNSDNYSRRQNQQMKRDLEYLNLLPASLRHNSQGEERRASTPVHTFGFGVDHDAGSMHAISEASGGTFSFIQTEGVIQDAFARCIGGLLSVVVQELKVQLTSASTGVSIGKIPAGNYSSEVTNQGQQAVINVGDLYADEAKDFLVHISVPELKNPNNSEGVMPLLSVGCTCMDPLSRETIGVDGQVVKISRPERVTVEHERICLEVDRQRNRLWVAEAIMEAQGLAEKGNLEQAQSVLANRRSVLLASASAQAGDVLCNWLEEELKEIRDRMASRELYEESGRAYVLSGLSSHSWQRATTRGDSITRTIPNGRENGSQNMSGGVGYETPSMTNMVTRSQTICFSAPQAAQGLQRSCSVARHCG